MRDLFAAAARYTDPVDRARALHRLADVATSAGDALMAREVLLLALEVGDDAQRAHARVRLYGLLDFKTGFKKWDHVTRVRCSLYNICHENVAPLEYVNTAPARVASYQNADQFGDAYINDASFAKLREVSVTYLVPDAWAQRIGATRASINLAGRNLYTFTDWTGMDPEARFLGGDRGGFGPLEQNNLPQLTSFVTTINISF